MNIPSDVLSAIKATPTLDLFPVTGTESFSGQVLKAHKLQFDSGARLHLTRLDLPFLAICTNQILLRAPAVKSTILRNPNVTAPHGTAGSPGTAGKGGTIGNPGNVGTNGKAGTNGGPGVTLALPPVYLFVEQVLIDPGSAITQFDLALDFSGVPGGAGGEGGRGGDGGFGGNGTPGVDGAVGGCKQPPGDGGLGGNGGPGGAGGAGGNGSDGGTLIYIGPQSGLDQLAWAKVINQGGAGGQGGKGGHGGAGGRGGSPGLNSMFCHGGRTGPNGLNGANGPDGLSGAVGKKGTVSLIVQPSLAELFS